MGNQANSLREFVRENAGRARVVAVSSGKGGVGRTSISVNLAIALASQGLRTTVLDADLGLANVEVLLGLNSLYNLQQIIQGDRSVLEIMVEGPGNIRVIPGSSGIAKLADLGPKARQNVLDGLAELQGLADFVIVDTMAGIGQNAVSFAAAADEVLIVTTPEPSAIVDGYAMIKTVHQVRQDAVLRLVVNLALNEQQARAVAGKLANVAREYLGCSLSYLGYVPRDPHVPQSVMQSQPFTLRFPNAAATRCVEDLALRLLDQQGRTSKGLPAFFRRFARNLGLASSA